MLHIRSAFKWLPVRALTILVCVTMFIFVAYSIFGTRTTVQNRVLLSEMAQQTLMRAERAADYAFITLSEIIASEYDDCSEKSVLRIQDAIYRRGVVKDVRVMDAAGNVVCSGLSLSGDTHMSRFDMNGGIVAKNQSVRFHLIDINGSGLVGLSWAVSQKRAMLAVLNVDSLMFDVFPQSLRDKAAATLWLQSDKFAQYLPSGTDDEIGTEWLSFKAISQRFPISAELRVQSEAFYGWNRKGERFIVALGVLFGGMLGWFVISVLSRDEDKVAVLRKALKRKEFIGYVQPVFDLDTQIFTGGEALARWQKADGSIVSPDEFISLAEDTGLIAPITWQMMENTLSQLSGFLTQRRAIRIGFNIAPAHLMADGFVDKLNDVLRKHNVPSRQIILELTERQPFEDILSAEIVLQQLRDMGFVISLDDTGTGHNGLSYVQNLGVDILKIDKHFVDLVGIDRVATKIVEMLVNLSYELNISTVAEGIETSAQMNVLREMGVNKGQGYLISKPLTPDMFMRAVEINAARFGTRNVA